MASFNSVRLNSRAMMRMIFIMVLWGRVGRRSSQRLHQLQR
jgi:hypothetical protein